MLKFIENCYYYQKNRDIPWSSDFIESIKNNEKEIAHYYLMYKYEIPIGGSPSEPQHEYMATLMRETIIKVMKQYDNTQTEKVYEALSWVGLMGEGEINYNTGMPPQPTSTWAVIPQVERLKILETYNNFKTNNIPCQ